MIIEPDMPARFSEDGVVCVPQALSDRTLELALEAYDWSLTHPGPGAAELPARGSGSFYHDLANPAAMAAYRELLECSEIGTLISTLWGGGAVWYMYEQIFRKSGGSTRRTPWHQDTPYLPVQGASLAVMWISFDPVPASQALEFVRASHRGPLYDGSRFDPDDDTAPIYGDGSLPRLPDIEADRSRWEILSWPTEPGDVIVFHPSVLHGGGATDAGSIRRTLSLRFFGDDAIVAARPGQQGPEHHTAEQEDPDSHPLTRMRSAAPGTPFRHPGFPLIHADPGTAT